MTRRYSRARRMPRKSARMMSSQPDHGTFLSRIADALDRLAPPPAPPCGWLAHPAYVWTGSAARAVEQPDAPALDLLRGIDTQKERVVTHVERIAAGHPPHDTHIGTAAGR